MITFRLKMADGSKIVDVPLPETVTEIRLSQYVDFIVCMRRLTEADIEKMENPVCVMADAVQAVSGIDLNTILSATVGDLYRDNIDIDGSLRAAYGWIAQVLTSYEPKVRAGEDCEFEHAGHKFKIPSIAKSPMFQKALLPDISTGQAVSAFEMMRLSEKSKKEKGDPTGNRMFTDYLYMIAFVAERDGLPLPIHPTQQRVFIEETIKMMEDVKADVALDIDFFLNSTLMHLNETHPILGSLSLPLLQLAVEMQRLSAKPTIRRSKTARQPLTV